MDNKKLGKTEFNISKLGLGTVQFGLDYGFTKKKTQDEVDEILSCANQHGINFIDTARSYGDSEEKIGNFISQNKNQFVIGTKLELINPEEAGNKDILKAKIKKSLEASLSKLKLNSLDVLQIHQTASYIIENEEFWKILISLKEKKEIASIGVSVYEEEETKKLLDSYGKYIDFFQAPYNIFDRRFENLEEELKKQQIGVIGRSVFLKGIIACQISGLPEELKDLKIYKERLEAKARSLSLKPAETALLYVYKKELITCAILGVDSKKELEENLEVVQKADSINDLSIFDDIKVTEQRLIDPRKWTSL